MRRDIRVLVASTAFLLFATFATDASWAQTTIARVGILDNSAETLGERSHGKSHTHSCRRIYSRRLR